MSNKNEISTTKDFLNQIYNEIEHNGNLANFIFGYSEYLHAEHGQIGLYLGAMAVQMANNLEKLAHEVNKRIASEV